MNEHTANADYERCEYHASPSPHFVMNQACWDRVLAQYRDAAPQTFIAGQVGNWTGTPVYVDDCPSLWECPRAHNDGSGAAGGDQ